MFTMMFAPSLKPAPARTPLPIPSVHEVYIDEEQLAWFEALLAEAPQRPVVVFTHAPPQGCGLKVDNNVHVRNRCAWLNHSGEKGREMVHSFLTLVQQSVIIQCIRIM